MIENIYQISIEKAHFLNKVQARQLKHQLTHKQQQYQTQALKLLEQQSSYANVLVLGNAINRIRCVRVRQAMDGLKTNTETQNRSRNIADCRPTIIGNLMGSAITRLQYISKKDSFEAVQQWCLLGVDDNKECARGQKLILGGNQQKHHDKGSIKNLSSLDISLIEPKHKQMSHNAEAKADEPEQSIEIEQLKQIIIQKQIQLRLWEQSQQQQVQELKHRLKQQGHLEPSLLMASLSCLESEAGTPAHETPARQASDILVAKFIRRNFQLEEKLEAAYELLRAVEPDRSTEFGSLLAETVHRRTANIDTDPLQFQL